MWLLREKALESASFRPIATNHMEVTAVGSVRNDNALQQKKNSIECLVLTNIYITVVT